MSEFFDVDAVLRMWGFKPIGHDIGNGFVHKSWGRLHNGEFVHVPLDKARSFATQLLMRN